MALQRLDKLIASTGKFSRREVKLLIKECRVLVDGHPGDILSWVLTGLLAVLLGAAVVLKPEKYGFQSNPAGGI